MIFAGFSVGGAARRLPAYFAGADVGEHVFVAADVDYFYPFYGVDWLNVRRGFGARAVVARGRGFWHGAGL